MKQYAIFSNDPSSLSIIKNTFDYFRSKENAIDCYIFSDNELLLATHTIATLSTFYMTFYKENIVFLTLSDFLSHKDNIISSKIYLYSSLDELLTNNINKNLLNNVGLMSYENGIIYEI